MHRHLTLSRAEPVGTEWRDDLIGAGNLPGICGRMRFGLADSGRTIVQIDYFLRAVGILFGAIAVRGWSVHRETHTESGSYGAG